VLRRLARALGQAKRQAPYWIGQTFVAARKSARQGANMMLASIHGLGDLSIGQRLAGDASVLPFTLEPDLVRLGFVCLTSV
jgi:hypothetical protein